MSDAAENMLQAMLQLPREDRELLWQHLGSSLDDDNDDPALEEELNRRLAEHMEERRTGNVKLELIEDDIKELREKLREARRSTSGSAA